MPDEPSSKSIISIFDIDFFFFFALLSLFDKYSGVQEPYPC